MGGGFDLGDPKGRLRSRKSRGIAWKSFGNRWKSGREEDQKGFLWTIDVPENFFGARNIQEQVLERILEHLWGSYGGINKLWEALHSRNRVRKSFFRVRK